MRQSLIISLGLLILTYGTMGWVLMGKQFPLYIWPLTGVWIFLISGLLTSPFTNSQKLILRWFQSDVTAFISIVVFSFLVVIIMAWLHLFANFLVLFSAAALARLDLQTIGRQKWQAFTILVVASLLGLSLGAGSRFLLYHWRILLT